MFRPVRLVPGGILLCRGAKREETMVIVIDIGNTNVKIVGMEGEQTVFTGKVPTERTYSAEDYAALLAPVLKHAGDCRDSVISSVVPPVTASVGEALTALLGKAPMVISQETDFGLTVALPNPEKVGRDRLVDAAWAAEHLPLPAVTADLGTATTLNVILPGKIFAGGVICTGIETGLMALAQRAAQLPQLEVRTLEHVIGKNTEEAMLSGAIAGTAGMLDGLVSQIEEEIGSPVTLAITGGGGKYVSPLVRHPHLFDPELTLKGLVLVYERSCGRRPE